MEPSNWSFTIKAVLEQLSHAAVLFVRMAGSDQVEWTSQRRKLLADEQNLADPLRVVRQWAAEIPDLFSIEANHMEISVQQLHLDAIVQLTNFLDALFLFFYRDGKLTPQWVELNDEEQRKLILCLSIALQCLNNLLSASRTLDQSIPIRHLQAILSMLTTGSRPRILLGQLVGHPLSVVVHTTQYQRLLSYAGLLYYSVLLHFESSPSGIEPEALALIAHKLVTDTVVLQSIVFFCDQPEKADTSRVNYQLLLCKLADILSAFDWTAHCNSELNDFKVQESLELIIRATGLVMLVRSLDLESFDANDSGCERKPQTVRPCLTFLKFHESVFGSRKTVLSTLMSLFVQYCESWCRMVIQLMQADIIDLDHSLRHSSGSDLLFSPIRGVVHILSELVLSDDTEWPQSIFLEEQEASIEHVWNKLCDLLVLFNAACHWLDQAFPVPLEPVQRCSADGSPCTVYPSRMTRAWPILPSSSPFSLCQAVGFLQDCLRCLVGLISTFPQLSFTLASHALGIQIPESVSQLTRWPNRNAFQCILDATNRDRMNPLASEWAVLLIKLAVKPESTNEKALEGARLLSAKITDLKLIH